ncbi:MAG: exosortase-associated protein EpsI, B-type [Burkholderiales bacterium]
MKRFERISLLVGAAMVLAAGAALALRPSPAAEPASFDLASVVPGSFGDWRIDPLIVPIVPAPDVQANLVRLYDQIVSRTYVNAQGERVMLTVAYGGDQSDALQAHRQEVCYAAQGFEIGNVRHGHLRLREKTIPVTRLLAVRGPRSEPVTYWFTMGDRVVLGRLERLLAQLGYGLSGRIPDGMLVRVSSLSRDPDRAFGGHEKFIGALVGGMREDDLPRLLGALEGKARNPPGPAKLLFSSGFEGATALGGPTDCYLTGCWQDISGTDSTTGFTWPPRIWGGGARFQLLPDGPVAPADIGKYMSAQIKTVRGRNGTPTRVLHSEITQKIPGASTQNVFVMRPAREEGDLYLSYWMRLQPDLAEKMNPQNWRSIFAWKTAGDYRVTAYVASWEDGCEGIKRKGALFWDVRGDNDANGGFPPDGEKIEFWKVQNCSIAVPVDTWFKFEVFWHRSSGADGRVWMAVNGQVIADRRGPNMGVNNARINRIFIPTYTGADPHIHQWVDDLEIWDGFPPDAGGRAHRAETGTPRPARP